MSTREWLGNAPAIAQINTITPANVEVGDIFTVTINNKSISYTAAAATVADVTAGLVALLNASTIPEFAEITWTDSTTHITATADTAGKPFTNTSSATDGGGTNNQTFVTATTTASEGPNDWSTPENWSGATVPVSTDTVVIGPSIVDIKYGLDQNAVTLASLIIVQGFTGNIGLPETNADATSYPEYRDTYLKISSTLVTIGEGDGAGSGRIKLNTGSNQTTIVIKNAGQPVETGIPALLWIGTHASNEVNIHKGSLGVAIYAGETATILTLRTTFRDNVDSDVEVTCGSGVTLNAGGAECVIAGGLVTIDSATTLITQTAGLINLEGTDVHAELNIDGGQTNYNTTGTLTTGRVGSAGTLDCSKDIRAKTITNLELNEGASLLDPNKVVTYTNGIDLYRTGVEKLGTIQLGDHYTLQRSVI